MKWLSNFPNNIHKSTVVWGWAENLKRSKAASRSKPSHSPPAFNLHMFWLLTIKLLSNIPKILISLRLFGARQKTAREVRSSRVQALFSLPLTCIYTFLAFSEKIAQQFPKNIHTSKVVWAGLGRKPQESSPARSLQAISSPCP